MHQHFMGELQGFRMGQVLPQPVGVQAHFVHADQADGAEVVLEGAQIPFGVGIQSRIQQFGDHGPLGLQAAGGNVHHMVQPVVEIFFIFGQIGDPGHVDGHHAHAACGFAGSEEPAGFLPQFPQIQAQPAAHAPHVAGFHIGVDVVGEVGSPVFGRHLEQQPVVLRIAPVKVLRNGIGGDRVLEAPAIGIAFDHVFDEGLVHHVHFLPAVPVGEVLFLAPHNGRNVLQIVRTGPVQGDVGEGCLSAPPAGCVDPVDEALDTLFHFFIAQVVLFHKRCQISIERGKSLGPGPFVLHDSQEIHHLVAQGGQMAGRRRSDLPGDAPQPFLDQLFQAPAGAVAGKHAQVVDVHGSALVGVGHFLVVDFVQPVVGSNGAAVGQDQASHRIGDRGIFLHPPVVHLQVIVHQFLVVQQGGVHVADLLPLFPVQDVGLGHIGIARVGQDLFHTVLDAFHTDQIVLDLGIEVSRHL